MVWIFLVTKTTLHFNIPKEKQIIMNYMPQKYIPNKRYIFAVDSLHKIWETWVY